MPTYPTNDKSGSENLVLLTLAVRQKCADLLASQGNLSTLTTEAKTTFVAAINELDAAYKALKTQVEAQTEIDDEQATATNVWSALKVSNQITSQCTALKNELLGGAGTAYDTLKELADLIDSNKDAIDALEAIAAGHVRFDQAQTLTAEQKAQALSNIGAAAASHTHAIADVTGLQDALDGKVAKDDIGDPHIDLAAIFANGVTKA